MGGNTKFKGARTRTATYEDTDGTRKAVRDSNGNIIRVGVGAQVGRGHRTNTTAANARNRILNAKAIQEVRDLAKTVRTIGNASVANVTQQQFLNITPESIAKSNDALKQLAILANQVEPGKVDALINSGSWTMGEIRQASKEVERILGVKLR